MLRYLLPQPLGEGDGGIEHRTRQDQQKLLAAVTTNAIDLARFVSQNLREFLEHRVARLMPVLVVHALELVDVAHDDSDGLVQPDRVLPHLVEAVLERAARSEEHTSELQSR